jgi:transposase
MQTRQYIRLRPLSAQERTDLIAISASRSESACVVAHAKQILAVADGHKFTEAAAKSGYKSGDLVARQVRRFNELGIDSLYPRHAGGHVPTYSAADREKIVARARSTPDREKDGTCTWSLSTLRRALQREGYPHISNSKIWLILHEAELTWQNSRAWCDTGTFERKRKSGVVTLTDPDTEAKKNSSKMRTSKPNR